MEVGRPMRFLIDSNEFLHIFGATRHDGLTIDTVQSLRSRGSLPLSTVGRQWSDIVDRWSVVSGSHENMVFTAEISLICRIIADFYRFQLYCLEVDFSVVISG
jgi:hypothetical protein